jgi:hypothetical protein
MRRFSEDHQMKDEALKLALEALTVLLDEWTPARQAQLKGMEAVTAIKQALAAPVQEPVAFFYPGQGFYWAKPTKIIAPVTVDVKPLPFYTTPPAQPAVPDAFGTREGEHPQYIQGWNDCRAEMLKGKP